MTGFCRRGTSRPTSSPTNFGSVANCPRKPYLPQTGPMKSSIRTAALDSPSCATTPDDLAGSRGDRAVVPEIRVRPFGGLTVGDDAPVVKRAAEKDGDVPSLPFPGWPGQRERLPRDIGYGHHGRPR